MRFSKYKWLSEEMKRFGEIAHAKRIDLIKAKLIKKKHHWAFGNQSQ